MPSFTKLESKALWLLAEHGASYPPPAIQQDCELREAGERAIGKVWTEHLLGSSEPSARENLVRGFLVGMVAGGALFGLVLL